MKAVSSAYSKKASEQKVRRAVLKDEIKRLRREMRVGADSTRSRLACLWAQASLSVLEYDRYVSGKWLNWRRNAYFGRPLLASYAPPAARLSYDRFVSEMTKGMLTEIGRIGAHIVHANDATTMCAAHLSGSNWLYDAHEWVSGSIQVSDEIRANWKMHEQEYIKYASKVTTVSPAIAIHLQFEYGLAERPSVVLNAPRLEKADRNFKSVRDEIGLNPSVPLLVYSGKIAAIRGLPTLIEALVKLDGCHLAIVCQDAASYHRPLVDSIKNANLQDRVHLLPFVPSDKVTSYLRDATIGIHPMSHFPNADVALPNKLFEYLHAKIPVVVSDVELMKKFVQEHGVGGVFEADNAGDLASTVRAVLGNYELFRSRITDEFLEQYSWQRQAEKLKTIYDEVSRSSTVTQS
jgi:glycosyltransferase involved in cell wall biosynthesis